MGPESTLFMTSFDLLITLAVVAAGAALYKNRRMVAQAKASLGGVTFVFGLLLIGLLHLGDLSTLFMLPLLIDEEASHGILLHLRGTAGSWVMLLAAAFLTFGFVVGTNRLAASRHALQLTQQAVDTSTDPIYWTNPDGRFVYVNEAACRTLGYSRGELLSMSVREIATGESDAQRPAFPQVTREQGTQTVRTRHQRKDGRVFPVEVTTNFNLFRGSAYHCSIVRNETEREEAREALEGREQRLREVLAEREQLNLDLHDGILQSLYAAGLGLESCKPMAGPAEEGLGHEIRRVIGQLNAIMREVRTFIGASVRHTEARQSVRQAFDHLIETAHAFLTLSIDLNVDEAVDRCLSAAQVHHLLYIAREALATAQEQRRAGHAWISLSLSGETALLTVRDDGVGGSPDPAKQASTGLMSVAARVERVGGTWSVSPIQPQGTVLTVRVPCEHPTEE